MAETPKKDWSQANELFKKAKKEARSKMSPEELAQALAEDEIGKRMRGETDVKAEIAENEERKNPEKIGEEKNILDRIYEENQSETPHKKTIADMIAEANKQKEELMQEALSRHEEHVEKLSKMPLEEKIKYEQKGREEARKKRMDKLTRKLMGGKNE